MLMPTICDTLRTTCVRLSSLFYFQSLAIQFWPCIVAIYLCFELFANNLGTVPCFILILSCTWVIRVVFSDFIVLLHMYPELQKCLFCEPGHEKKFIWKQNKEERTNNPDVQLFLVPMQSVTSSNSLDGIYWLLIKTCRISHVCVNLYWLQVCLMCCWLTIQALTFGYHLRCQVRVIFCQRCRWCQSHLVVLLLDES